MANECSEKKKFILERSKEAIENYSDIKEGILKTRENLDAIGNKLDENITNLQRSVKVFEALPEEQVSNPTPILGSMLNSGCQIAGRASVHAEHLKDKFQGFTMEPSSLAGSTIVGTTTSYMLRSVAVGAAKTISAQYREVRGVVDEVEAPTPFEESRKVEPKLRQIDERLADKLKGMWQTFKDESKKDRCQQAAHSMREVVSQFLQILAPDKEVKRTNWYKPEGDSDRPTQKQRVKYAIIGQRAQNALDEKDLRTIDKLMDATRKMYDDLSEIAHDREKEESELSPLLETYIATSQRIIMDILDLREKFFVAN